VQYLNRLKENERIVEHYLCRQKQALLTKAGKTYYSLKLQDKTAVLDAKVWEVNEDIGAFEEGDVIKIDGIALLYQGDMQIKIARLRKSLQDEYELEHYIPKTEKDIDELYGKLLGFIDSVGEPHLRKLLELILIDNEVISAAIPSHTAAKNMHHSYLGGLLEHTIAVAEICDFLSPRFKYVNRDLLITSALLHDIAKILELSPLPLSVYTDDGQMLGHLYMGAELISRECMKIPDFPHELESLLKHSILSHHGEYIFGSPKLPMTIEAFILHAADNLDSKAKIYEDTISADNTQGPWTGYHRALERYIRRSDF
jgi:3'-5' exoribonuclease